MKLETDKTVLCSENTFFGKMNLFHFIIVTSKIQECLEREEKNKKKPPQTPCYGVLTAHRLSMTNKL